MSDQNNAPELPARIWAWSEDDDFLRAKPHGVMHGTEYIRADRAAPEGQVRAKIEGLIEDAIANAEVDYPAGREAGHSITWDSDRLLDDIIAALTPPPAAQEPVARIREYLMKHDHHSPPACQQEAVADAELAAARAEIEWLTKERDLSKELLRSCIQGNNVLRKKAQKAIAERDEARSMLADAERDMRQRAADYLQSAVDDWRSDGHEHAAKKIEDEIPGVLALPLKHADRENDAAFAQGQKEGAER